MKNSKSKVLMTSVIMLVVAVMALTTATYAWFISSTEAKVNQITMQSASAEGIRFSVDGENWKNTLTVGETGTGADIIINAPTQADDQTKWLPTSTNFQTDGWKFYYVNSYENGKVTIAEDTANYIAFSFYIQLDGTNAAGADGLYLTTAGIGCEGELDSALRVAFILNGKLTTPASGEATVDTTTGTYIVWQPGQESAESYSPLIKATGIDEETGEDVTVAIDNFHITEGAYIGAATGTEEGKEHKVDSYFTTNYAFDLEPEAGKTQAQYKVTIVIWIEGQDAQCTNAVASQFITADFAFGFTAPEPTPEEGQ